MQSKSKCLFFLFILMLAFALNNQTVSYAKTDVIIFSESLNAEESAFDHKYGPPGYYGLAIDEEENLIFSNAPEGVAFIQRDNLSDQVVYRDEIGLQDVSVMNLEVDKELKLLYVGSIQGVDVINYTHFPIQATPILQEVATNFVLGDFIDVDPDTHFVWITTQSHGLFIYDPINQREVDTAGYNLPDPSVKMHTIEVNPSINRAFIGTDLGIYVIDTLTNSSHKWLTTTDGLPFNITKVIKAYPEIEKVFIGTNENVTTISGGLTVLFLNNDSLKTYDYISDPYNPRTIYDIVCDTQRNLGYFVSGPGFEAESGLMVFNLTDMTGVIKSKWGSFGDFGVTSVWGSPYLIEAMIAGIELDEITHEVILGSIQLIQKAYLDLPATVTTENEWIDWEHSLSHNIASDVNYDPVDDMMYISTLLGLDRIDPTNNENVEHLVPKPGAGGSTAAEILSTARMVYHHHYEYNIIADSYIDMVTMIPALDEYDYIKDISSSPNETLIYYSIGAENGGLGSNGSIVIYNRANYLYYVEDFGFDKTQLIVNCILQDPNREMLYVGTNTGLILYNLTSMSIYSIHGETENWEITTLEWINEQLWFGLETEPHLYTYVRIYDPILETITDFEPSAMMYPVVNDILFNQATNELFFTTNYGFHAYNISNEELKFFGEEDGLSTYILARMDYSTISNEIYIGSTLGGVNIFDPLYDDIPPQLFISGISTNDIVTGQISIQITSQDYSGINWVSATLNSSDNWNSNIRYLNFDFNSSEYSDGYYEFTIVATDFNGLTTGIVISFTISNVIINEFSKMLLVVVLSTVSIITLFRKRRN